MRLALASAMLLMSGRPAVETGVWKSCSISTVSICTPAGCAWRKPAISIFVADHVEGGVERAAYYRCELRVVRCDRYIPLVHRTGDFVVFSLPSQSVFAKLAPDGRITDVAAVKDTVFVSRGRCTPGAPPRNAPEKSG